MTYLRQLLRLGILGILILLVLHSVVVAQPPQGSLDCPNASSVSMCYANGPNGTGLAGAINVTGWALSADTVTKVSIFRDPVAGETPGILVPIQDAPMIPGSRPDVASNSCCQDYPNNDWGYGTQVLTNMLRNSNGSSGTGNGTYTLHAIAYDYNGSTKDIGQ